MSARYLRKVLKEQELGKSKEDHNNGGDGDESDASPDSSSLQASLNPFDLLEDDDNHDQVYEPEIADEPLRRNVDVKEPSSVKATVNAVSSSNNKAKKKKKKKNKEYPSSRTESIEKPLDVMVEDLSFDEYSCSQQSGPLKANPENVEADDGLIEQYKASILQLDPKFLSAENELRRIFGSKVVNSFQKSHQPGSSRQIRGVRRGSHIHRRTILVSPAEHWPRWDGSLSMELLETRDGYHYFKYVHSSSYSQAQRAFEAAKAIHDFNGITSILLHHPYHLESLITVADYFSISGEHQMSADYIAKCMYALECAWHPMFSPLQGNSQLKYSHESNRPLFHALFTHMKNMDRRGCHRCALEICKLLLSLDSDDHKGATFCIDYFSLRSEEYRWLERFSEEYISDPPLSLFPNFSYSLSICRFYLEREASSKDYPMESGKASSTDLLKQALMLHPPVLKKLVEKVPLKDQAWTNLLKNSFFASDQTGNPSVDHMINIYVARSYLIWRLPDLQKLLRDSALLVIETLKQNRSEAQDWACVRNEAFSSKKNEYSHLLVSDFSDTVPTVPPENLLDFLPVDPRMAEVQHGDQVVDPPNGAEAPHNAANRNPFAVFFESMMPWFDFGGREGIEDDQHNGNLQDDGN